MKYYSYFDILQPLADVETAFAWSCPVGGWAGFARGRPAGPTHGSPQRSPSARQARCDPSPTGDTAKKLRCTPSIKLSNYHSYVNP